EDGIRDRTVTGVQTCALPICGFGRRRPYIAIGGLLLLMSTPLLVDSSSMLIFLVGLSLLLIGKNVLTPAYQSLVPDHVSKEQRGDRKSTRLNSSHRTISYAVF